MPWHNELTWRDGGPPRKPPAGWAAQPPGLHPGSPRTTVIPPRTRRWPLTWRPGGQAPANRMHDLPGPRHRVSSTGPLPGALGRTVAQVVVGAAGYDGRGVSGTPSRASAGSRSTTPADPAGQASGGLSGSASTRPTYGSSRPTSPATRWPADCARPGSTRNAPKPVSCSKGWPSTWSLPSWRTSSGSFRQVAAPGSSLAISVSLSRPRGDSAPAPASRPRLAALGGAGQIHVRGRRGRSATRPDRLAASRPATRRRPAGCRRRRPPPTRPALLLASAGPATPAGSSAPARASPRPSQPPQGHDGALPLSGLAVPGAGSRFTIEFDNEAEQPPPAPHHQPRGRPGPRRRAPRSYGWLSLAMWEKLHAARYRRAHHRWRSRSPGPHRVPTWTAMRRWGYITIDGTAQEGSQPAARALAPCCARQRRACGRERSGCRCPVLSSSAGMSASAPISSAACEVSLTGMVSRLDPGLPDCLPILGPALLSQGPDPRLPPRSVGTGAGGDAASGLAVPGPAVPSPSSTSVKPGCPWRSPPTCWRVLGTDGTRLRDLPALTGTSKESVRWALGILTRGDLAAEEPDPARQPGQGSPGSPPRGIDAQRLYHELTSEIERRWHDRFTPAMTVALRASLEPLAAGQPPPLSGGLEPYPDKLARLGPTARTSLPHFPMVLQPRRLSGRQLTRLRARESKGYCFSLRLDPRKPVRIRHGRATVCRPRACESGLRASRRSTGRRGRTIPVGGFLRWPFFSTPSAGRQTCRPADFQRAVLAARRRAPRGRGVLLHRRRPGARRRCSASPMVIHEFRARRAAISLGFPCH